MVTEQGEIVKATRMIANSFWVVLAATFLAMAACGGGTSEDVASPEPAAEGSPTTASEELQMALAVSDLSVGVNRVAFGLIELGSGALRDVRVVISTFDLTDPATVKETVEAVFRKWPVGPGGIYTAQLTFDRPGSWGIGAVATDAAGLARSASIGVRVTETSVTPAIGSPAPRTVTKTVRDVASLDEMTTDPDPDPEMYALTIAEALAEAKPLVVAFSTPAYCTSATCGPQLDLVKELRRKYKDRVNFIHVEVYDNPLEIQGDLSRGRLVPAITEWNLPSEPWTFIVDSDGLVQAKFEGFATTEELEAAIAAVLE